MTSVITDLQQQIQSVVDQAVNHGTEDGVQVAVYRDGRPVAEVTAGVADVVTGRALTADTVIYSASTGKGAAAALAHVLVDRGVIDYDTPLVRHWPEFGAHGKHSTTLRHILTHSTGVPALPADVTVTDLCDWEQMTTMIAGLEPRWPAGTRVGYHAGTFGYLLGEVLQRATGRSVAELLVEHITGPLGIAAELHFGVPPERLGEVANLTDDPTGAAIFASLAQEFPLFAAAPRQVVPNAAYGNRGDVLTAALPFQGIMTARAMARVYAALLGEVDGVRLITPERLVEASTLATDGLLDEMTGGPSVWSLGYCVGWPGTSAAAEHPTMFGMVGIGGSGAWADRKSGTSVAVTKNRFHAADLSVLNRVSEIVSGASRE